MLKRMNFIAEPNRGFLFPELINKFAMKVFAEEEPDTGHEEDGKDDSKGGSSSHQFNFEQMVAQARKEEKDKLYPRIKKLEEENKTLTTSINKYLLENAALKDEIEKFKNNSGDSEKITTLKSEVKLLKEENEKLKSNTPNEEELRKKIESEYEVKLYAQEQITANKDTIISILVPEIKGATKEEIDEAIKKAKEQTIAVKKDLGIEVDDDGNSKGKPDSKKKDKPGKAPAAAPASDSDEGYDAEYVRNLDPRSDEYKEFRKKMGLK